MIKRVIASERFLRVSREGFWVISGNLAAIIGLMAGVRVITGLLAPAEYGQLALGMTLATLVEQIVMSPLSQGIVRFYAPAVEQNELNGYFSVVRRMVLSAVAITIVITFVLIAFLLIAKNGKWIPMVGASSLLGIISGFNSMMNGMQNAARQRSIVALHQGVESWARFLIAAALMLWLGATSAIAMSGYAAAVMLIIISQSMFFRRLIRGRIDREDKTEDWQEKIWNFSWPFGAWVIFTWAQFASSRWGLEFFATTYDVGLYAALFQVGYYPVSVATIITMQFLAPILYQRAGDASDIQRRSNVNRITWRLTCFVLGVSCLAFLIAVLFHSQIFRIFVAKEYGPVSYLMPWMVFSGGIFAAGQTIALNLMSQKKTFTMMWAKIFTALFGIALNFIGAYLFGTKGVVCAGFLFTVSYFLWMLVLVRSEGGKIELVKDEMPLLEV